MLNDPPRDDSDGRSSKTNGSKSRPRHLPRITAWRNLWETINSRHAQPPLPTHRGRPPGGGTADDAGGPGIERTAADEGRPPDAGAGIEEHRKRDYILLDTVGRSPKDLGPMSELADFLKGSDQADVHLVLSATTKTTDMNEVVNRFALGRVYRNLITNAIQATDAGGRRRPGGGRSPRRPSRREGGAGEGRRHAGAEVGSRLRRAGGARADRRPAGGATKEAGG